MTKKERSGRQQQMEGTEREAEGGPQPAEEVVFLSGGSLTVAPEGLTQWGPFPGSVWSGGSSEGQSYNWTGGGWSATLDGQGGISNSPLGAEGPGS